MNVDLDLEQKKAVMMLIRNHSGNCNIERMALVTPNHPKIQSLLRVSLGNCGNRSAIETDLTEARDVWLDASLVS